MNLKTNKMNITTYKQHPTNKGKKQVIEYLIINSIETDCFFCIDGTLIGHDLKVKGCDIERYKQRNNINK